MRRGLWTWSIVGLAALCGCGGANQALVASGGRQDFAEMERIGEEYGTDPDATVPVAIGETQNTYRVWISKNKQRIMVQTASVAGVAAAGFVRGLTAGLVQGDIEYEPLQQAANDYLTAAYGPGCTIANSRKLTRVGWEWDFNCPPSQAAKRRPTR